MKFADLNLSTEVGQAIGALGFDTPTPIQELMIPEFLDHGKDLVGLAHTGTGKTAAFGLPLIDSIDISNTAAQALILCPTRELCIQITAELGLYAGRMPTLTITSVYGGDSYERQIRALRRGSHIVVATPGRILDLINRRKADIGSIRYLILDEADIMLNMGFKDELDAILSAAPAERRTILLSATMPSDVGRIAQTYMNDPVELSAGARNTGPQEVDHRYYSVSRRSKYAALKRIVDYHPDMYGIVFCRTKASTQEIASNMVRDGYNSEPLHGDLSQAQREQVMRKFRSRTVQLLVATDIAARGLDVDDLTHVIHFDLPTEADAYTHRSGRTGRAGKSGTSLALVTRKERSRLGWIERTVKREFKEERVPKKRDICRRQLQRLIDRVTSVEVDTDQIEPYLPMIEKELAGLSREDLIKRFLSLEFNRFIEYYRNAEDIESEARPEARPVGRSMRRAPRGGREARDRRPNRMDGFGWLAISLGKKNRVLPTHLIGLINQSTRSDHIRLGRIDIGPTKSWVQVESEYIDDVEAALRSTKYKGRTLRVERTEGSPRGKRAGGRRKP